MVGAMPENPPTEIPIWGIPRVDPGYIYVIQSGSRLKIGKSKDRYSRIRAARTWLPDMTLVGIKPFWLVHDLEKDLHEGLAQWWYEGEWFDLGDDEYLENFLFNFRAFLDSDERRDANSINFVHWMNDMVEISCERERRGQKLRPFQRDISSTSKYSRK